MKWISYLPYYSDLKVAGLFAIAYAAFMASFALVFFGAKFARVNFGLERSLAFCSVASGVLWLLPLCSFVPEKYSNYFLLGLLFIICPFIKMIYELDWKQSFIVWAIFALTQFSLYLFVINKAPIA